MNVINDTQVAIDDSRETIKALKLRVLEEQGSQQFLDGEKVNMQSTVDKINTILGTDV